MSTANLSVKASKNRRIENPLIKYSHWVMILPFLILFLISTFNKPKKEQEIGVPNQIDVNSGLDSTVINEAKKDVLIDTNIG